MAELQIVNNRIISCNRFETDRRIIIPEGVTEIGPGAFEGCMFTEEIILPESLVRICGRAFRGMRNLRCIRIPEKVRFRSSDRDILSGCGSLSSIELGETCEMIPDGFASECTSLEHIVFPDALRTIGKSAFQSCVSLREAIMPENLSSIGENSFRGCRELRRIKMGRGVTDIGSGAFTGIDSAADIICDTDREVFASFRTNIRSLRDAADICAPEADIRREEPYMKVLLACGYILHPELRNKYREGMNGLYREYIQNLLPGYALELCSKGMMFRILTESVSQRLIDDPVTIDTLAAHARSCVVSDKEKAILDNITEGTSAENKLILRKLRSAGDPEEWDQLVRCYGDTSAAKVRYSDSDEAAPPEMVSFVLYTYLDMFRKSTGPGGISLSRTADEMAGHLNKLDLTGLCLAWCGNDPADKLPEIPGLLFPLLRYADEKTAERILGWSEHWSNHFETGSRGYEVLTVLSRAILLSDTAVAASVAYDNEMLADYAKVRGKTLQILFREWLGTDIPENDRTIYEGIVYSYYSGKLRSELLSTTSRSYTAFIRFFDNDCVIRELRNKLIFSYRDGNSKGCFVMADGVPQDVDGNELELSPAARICLAHAADMEIEEITTWKKRVKAKGGDQIEQIDVRIPLAMRADARSISPRYAGLTCDLETLHARNNGVFAINGTHSLIRLSFRGKTVLELKAIKTDDQSENPSRKYLTGPLIMSGFNDRELSCMISALDIIFFPQLIHKGVIEASEYPELTDPGNIDELLRYSIESAQHENTAYFLGRKQEYASKCGSPDPDEDLDW